jgi:hypothetical protein
MDMNPEIIVKFLNKIVTPKWNGILEYIISFYADDETGEIYPKIKVIYDADEYWKTYDSGEYDYPGEMEYDIESDIRRVLKYLSIDECYVEINEIDA